MKMNKYEKAQMACDKALCRAESMPAEQKVRHTQRQSWSPQFA